MFTGIVTNIGEIVNIKPSNQGLGLIFTTDFPANDVKLGDSVAINGACTTITEINEKNYHVDLSEETLSRTYFKKLKIKDKLNLELSLTPNSRLGGHFVSGHVDEVGVIRELSYDHHFAKLSISFGPSYRNLLIKKGSITVDGISLTIAHIYDNYFECAIIPYTVEHTTLKFKANKNSEKRVNLEYDLLGKYIVNYMSNIANSNSSKQKVNDINLLTALTKSGFIK